MMKGEVRSWYGNLAAVELENKELKTILTHRLAPIDPTDHPLHPNFKGNK
jgi:homogentisate 1,2-dioxygenase